MPSFHVDRVSGGVAGGRKNVEGKNQFHARLGLFSICKIPTPSTGSGQALAVLECGLFLHFCMRQGWGILSRLSAFVLHPLSKSPPFAVWWLAFAGGGARATFQRWSRCQASSYLPYL